MLSSCTERSTFKRNVQINQAGFLEFYFSIDAIWCSSHFGIKAGPGSGLAMPGLLQIALLKIFRCAVSVHFVFTCIYNFIRFRCAKNNNDDIQSDQIGLSPNLLLIKFDLILS